MSVTQVEDIIYNTVIQIKVNVININYPMTVCRNPKCIEYKEIKDFQGRTRKEIIYKTICHKHCWLRNVPVSKYIRMIHRENLI